MSARVSFGIAVLVVASLCLIAGAAYTYYALSHPKDYTFYQPWSTPYIVPRISTAPITAFVVVEPLLVGGGIALLRSSAK